MCKIFLSCNVESCTPALYKSFTLNHMHIKFVSFPRSLVSFLMSALQTAARCGGTLGHAGTRRGRYSPE